MCMPLQVSLLSLKAKYMLGSSTIFINARIFLANLDQCAGHLAYNAPKAAWIYWGKGCSCVFFQTNFSLEVG